MPEVSVIIPNYNHAPFLRKRIDSVLNQTFRNFELIILDDCSTDNSSEIIESYRSHLGVKHIIYNPVNGGSTFKQWRKGVELASGDFIWLAESDDYAKPEFLETVLAPLKNDPNVMLSYCQSLIVDESDKPLFVCNWADFLDNKKWKKSYIEDAAFELDNYLKYRNTIPNASAVVFRKPKELGLFDEIVNMRFSGDWFFWKTLLSRGGKISFSEEILNFFRMHSQSTRHVSTLEKEKQRIKEFNLFIDIEEYRISDSRYDWMLIFWFEHRAAFKGTFNYFVPAFPLKLKIRTYILVFQKLFKRTKRLFQPKIN